MHGTPRDEWPNRGCAAARHKRRQARTFGNGQLQRPSLAWLSSIDPMALARVHARASLAAPLEHTGETPICKQQKVSGSTAVCDHRSSIGDSGNARMLRGALLSLTLYGMISWNLSIVTVQKRKCSVSLFLLCAL